MFKEKTAIDKLILANGRILLERTKNRNIYKVLKVAKNANYEALCKSIEIGDLVITSEYLYSNIFKLDGKEYFMVKPNSIGGYFDNCA